MSTSRVEQLAAAVVDGDSVDWESAEALLASDSDRAVAAQLQRLSSLGSGIGVADVVRAARLPLILRVATVLARTKCLLGIIGYLIIWSLDGPASPPIFLVGIGVFAGAAIWLDVTGRDDRRARALAGVYWTSAASFSHDLMFSLAGLELVPVDLTILRGFQPEAFFPVFLWQFARDFPRVIRFGVIDRLTRAGVVTAAAAAVTLFAANLLARLPGLSMPAMVSVLDRSYDQGRWYWLIVFVAAVTALMFTVARGVLAEGEERMRVRFFLWSVVAAVAPVTILVLLESSSPAFSSFMRTDVGRVIGAMLVYPAMFISPFATAHAVLAHDVLDVTAVAQRTLRYLLTRWLVAWGTFVPLAILLGVIYVRRAEPLTEVLSTPHARVLVWIAAGGALLLAFRESLLRGIDRWMLRGLADPSEMLAELGGELRNARTLLEVSTLVAGATERTMQTDVSVYFVEDNDALICVTEPGGHARTNSLVPVLLQGAGGPSIVDPRGRGSYFGLLSPEDRRWIQREGIIALCPIMPSGAGRVRAVIALKARRSALGLSRTDVQFLTAVCAAASLAHGRLEQMATATSPQEELGLHCDACHRVERWQPAVTRCECGGAWERAALPDIVAGRYRLQSLIGSGGMGVVYKAQDLVLHRSVAVKTLPRLSAAAAERLLDEARMMAALSHAHIAVLYGAEQWRGTPVLAVEYLEGGTLATRLQDGRLPMDLGFDIATALAETLAYMHATNRCHGDIKPSNIAFSAEGVVKFLDFGLSRALRTDGSDDRPAGGTLAYLSPDVLAGGPPGQASDVWALSVVIFQLLTGMHPFLKAADMVASIRVGLQDTIQIRTLVPQEVADLLRRLLSVAPGERPLTAAACLDEVTRVRIGLSERFLT